MKKCLFCPNRADSLEHVLPQWLLRCISPETEGAFPVQVGRYVEGQGDCDERKHVSLNFKARIVCVECNNGWLRKLESEVCQILKPLTGKQFPVLADIYFDELRRHSHVIARWLTKTALTTSMALPAKQRLSASFADEIMRGNAPAEVWIDVADAELPCVAAAITKTFPIINGNIPIGVRDCGDMCFQFCLQINHLLLRVGLSPHAEVRYTGPKPFRLFPKADQQVPEYFRFRDVNYFLHSVTLKTWEGCSGEVPLCETTK
ncbi:MAG: hypothetical protein WBW41_14480 [Verrucomicrobiia bacterium]